MLKKRTARIPAAKPNWADNVSVTYEFSTDIFVSQDGTERREATRSEPRISLSYATLLHRELKQRHMNDIAWSQDAQFYVPVPWRAVEAISGAGAVLNVSAVPFWIVPGVRLVVDGASAAELVTVASIAGTAITLTAPIVNPVFAGDAVRPVLTSRMSANAPLQFVTDDVLSGDESYEADPGSDPVNFAPYVPPQLNSVDVAPWAPDWAGGIDGQMQSLRRQYDPGVGRIYTDNPRDYNQRVFRASFWFGTQTEGEEFLSFFNRQRGRRGQFHIDLGISEFSVSQSSVTGTNSLVFEGSDFYDTFGSSYIFHSVYAAAPWGSQANQIASVTLTPGGNSSVNFVDPWGGPITSSTRLSWWHAWRFATDKLEARWITDQVVKIDTALQAIPTA